MFKKKLSKLMVALMLLAPLVVYAADPVPEGTYTYVTDPSFAEVAFMMDGSETTYSHSNAVIVSYSWQLVVPASGDGTLTFNIQTIYITYQGQEYSGDLTGLEVDFDGDEDFSDATTATIINNTVTLVIPESELTAEQHFYPAKVTSDIQPSGGPDMPDDIEFMVDFSGLDE